MGQESEFQELIQQQGLNSGDVFSHIDYERFKSGLSKLAEELGYFRAEFVEHRVEIDLNDYVARVFLNIDGGPRYRFGEVSLHQDILEQEFLQRYLPFQQGDPYSLDKLVELQRALNDTRYFQTVEVSPGQATMDSTEIPVDVTLTPRKNNRYEVGVGYGTDTGARTRFGWERPRVNKKGHRFDSSIGWSEIGHKFEANYRVPILNPRTDQLVYTITDSKEDLDDYDSKLRTVGVSLNRNYDDWRETLAIDYEREDFDIGNDNDDTTLIVPGASWSRTWGENFIFVLDGLRFDFGFRGSGEDLGSDVGFVQGFSRIKFISSLNRDNRIIARGSVGSLSTDEFSQLPPSVRFFTGGSQSVRGYKYKSLGPEDDSGDVIGGRRLLIGSLEFDHALNDNWGVAVFYDAGNAIEDFSDDLEHGAGFGLRWKSPIGPVRIDLASALSKDGDPWRLHLNIGPDL
jgi:translocation and assembly module TamA